MFRLRSRVSFAIIATVFTVAASARASDMPPPLTIEGYTDQLSYKAGDVIGIHISTTGARYSMEISRLGTETKTD